MSTGFASFSLAMVEADWPPDCPAEQKLPKPCVGKTGVVPCSSAARRCAEAYCARASVPVCSGPSRSGRPVVPYSSDPPVNTPVTSPPASST